VIKCGDKMVGNDRTKEEYEYRKISCPREEISKLMERECHHSRRSIKCFFYSITMVNINIDIKHSLMDSK